MDHRSGTRSRRKFVQGVGAAGLALLAGCGRLPQIGQQPAKVPRIGVLASSAPEPVKNRLAAFQQALRELGYVEGKNVTIEYRFADGEFERLPELAAELVRLSVDVFVTEGAAAARAAENATSVIPIVIGNASDPVGSGLVASLARPGGNVTGLSTQNRAITAKRLELLKEVAPTASRVAVLWNPSSPGPALQLEETRAAGTALRVTLLVLEVREADDIDRAFTAMGKESAGALLVTADPLFRTQQRRISKLAMENLLPAIYPSRESVDAGGLMSYATNFDGLYRRAAVYVDKILKGAKPAELPVEQPTTFEFVINLKTAQALGLTIPQHVLLQATEVIQ
jgi:putative ABC transport system substrate-binding protein